jgi:hypothetical protein
MKDLTVETNWILALIYRILNYSPTRRPQDNQLVLTLKEALTMLDLSIDHIHKLSEQRNGEDERVMTENKVRYNLQWMNFALESIGQRINTPKELIDKVHELEGTSSDLMPSVYRELPAIEDGLAELNRRITDSLSDFMGKNQAPGRPGFMRLEQ